MRSYNPDVVDIVDKEHILGGVDYYIGDGSSVTANLVKRRGGRLFGHTRIRMEINWFRKYGIQDIIFTHLGKGTIAKEADFAAKYPEAQLTYDGMELII